MDVTLVLKLVHLLGVVLFIGNIVVTGWWKVMADRTRDPAIVAFAQRQVTATDWVFTLGGVVLVTVGGVGNALHADLPLGSGWTGIGMALFVLSGVVWGAILIPVQIRQHRMALGFSQGTEIPAAYWRLCRAWIVWGTVATVLPLAAIPFMVWKVP